MTRVLGLILLAQLAMSEAAPGQTSTDEIRELRGQFDSAIARHDVDGVLSFLDSEYQITVGSGGLFQGKAEESRAWQAEFARADDLVYVRTPESVEISSSDDRAAEIGTWVGSWTTREGSHRRGGRYAAHWRKVDGSWKIRAELFVTLWCEGADCS